MFFAVAVRSLTVSPFVGHSDAPRGREVEQIRSNLMALIRPIGSRSYRMGEWAIGIFATGECIGGRRAAANTLMHTRRGLEFNVDPTGLWTH